MKCNVIAGFQCHAIQNKNQNCSIDEVQNKVTMQTIQMGTNMAAGKQQKHLSLSFATKARVSRGTQKRLKNTFSNTRTVQMAKFPEISPEISPFLNTSVFM